MENSIKQEKQQLRTLIKELKSKYSISELLLKSESIFKLLTQFDEITKAKTILAYWSLSDEVNTHHWVESNYKNKQLLLPVVSGDHLLIKPFEGETNMTPVPPFGIKEPKGNEITDLSVIEIVIVPGMAFDKAGYRMGRGKGYYDRFLPQISALKIGICFDFQMVEKVPINEFDIKMDFVVTESKIYNFTNKKALF